MAIAAAASQKVALAEAQGRPLRRGRHGLSPEEVARSQRFRMLRAMAAVVSAKGYAATTVADVVSTAKVSRNAFYEQFTNKEDCFLDLCAKDTIDLAETVIVAADGETWIERCRLGLRAYLRWWQERPELTYAYLVEMPRAGEAAAAQRAAALGPFERIFEGMCASARATDPSLAPVPGAWPRIWALGVIAFVTEVVRTDGVGGLAELEDDILSFTVRLVADGRATRDLTLTPAGGP